MLLPIHRFSFPEAGFFSFLNGRPSFLQNKSIINKSIIRWIILVCFLITLLWFEGRRVADLGLEYLPPLTKSAKEHRMWESRKGEVRYAFKHAWSGYKSMAFPDDELLPTSGNSTNKLRSSYFVPILTFN